MSKFDYVKLDDYLASTTDLSVAISNALAYGLGADGGTIDATNVDLGGLAFETPIDVSKPLTLLLGAGNFPVGGATPPSVLFDISPPASGPVSFRLVGVDPTATAITAAAGGTTLFQLSGDFQAHDGDGKPYFCVERLTLDGNASSATSVMISTSGGYPTLNFEDGLLVVQDCTITNFGGASAGSGASAGAAIQIGPSVLFCRFHRNEFMNNYQAIYLDNNTEASITENFFVQGPSAGGPTLTLVGPMHRVNHNYFFRHTLTDDSNQPDILLLPQAAWASQSGGGCWIEDNRFCGERENLDPRRTRIKLFSQADAGVIGGAVAVRGNFFLGPQATIAGVSSTSTVATVTLAGGFTTQGLTPGTAVTVNEVSTQLYNGTFAVLSVISGSQFSYTLPAGYNGSGSGGVVTLAASSVLGFTPMALTSVSSAGYTVTATVASTAALTSGQVVTINGVDDAHFNGTYVITVAGPTQFTYTFTTPYTGSGTVGVVYPTNGGAITLMNPHVAWDVSGNQFVDYSTLVNDYQVQIQNSSFGQSLWVDNRVYNPSPAIGYQIFANEGRNFTVVRPYPGASPPVNTTFAALDGTARSNETRALRNRIAQSERLDLWSNPRSITVTSGLTDPFGTLRAFQLALGGLYSAGVSQPIDLTGLVVGSRLVVKFWAKQGIATGALSSLNVGVYDATTGHWYGNLFTVSLGSDWQQYKLVTNGLVSVTDAFALAFYPGDPNFLAGDVLVFGPQVSDDDTDYYPTGSSAVYDPTAGNRFDQAAMVTCLKAMTHTGAAMPSPPSSTWTGGTGPTGTVVLDTGSSDLAGVVILSPTAGPPTSGNVTVQYAQPYAGTSMPVVVAGLLDGTGAWSGGAVRVSSTTNATFVLEWSNGAALSTSSTYMLTYIVVGLV